MFRWLRSLFAWKPVRSNGAWVYCENAVTGRRSAHQKSGVMGPFDRDFMRKGDTVHTRRGSYVIGSPDEHWF